MARKSKKRIKQLAAKNARKAAMVARHDDPSKAPTKYRLRKEARKRGEPMKSRPYPPWWHAALSSMFVRQAQEREAQQVTE